VGADLTFFNYLTGFSRQRSYRQLLVAPVNMRDHMRASRNRTLQNGFPGRIVAKMNALD